MLKFDKEIYLQNLRQKARVAMESRPFSNHAHQGLKQDVLIYQAELEIQNDELMRTRDELLEARNDLFNMYNRSPVGFAALDEKAEILKANFTFARMLGLGVNEIIYDSFINYIHKDFIEEFRAKYQNFFEKPADKAIQTKLSSKSFMSDILIKGKKNISANGHIGDDNLIIAIVDMTNLI